MAAVFSHLNIICARYSLHDHYEPPWECGNLFFFYFLEEEEEVMSVVMRWEHGGLKEENKNIIKNRDIHQLLLSYFERKCV